VHAWLRHSAGALAAAVALPAGAVALALRPAWREGIAERLGLGAALRPGSVWVHGASVGEVLAALRLIDALRARGHPVMGSASTVAGRAVLGRERPEVPRRLSPLDHPWSTAAALRRVSPSALVLVETELWPSWIAAAARRKVPVAVVSGRISDRSLPRYRRLAPLLRGTLARLARVGARGEEDARRFVAIGVPAERVRVTGDLKLEPPAVPPALAPDLARLIDGVEPAVAASTHPGEERVILDALERAERAGAPAAWVVAPRRPDRAREVVREVAARGRRARRRTDPGPGALAPGEVLVLDTLGELPALMARARFVFVGGSLVAAGGHNVLEPALVGRPVLFGPHTDQSREASERLVTCGGARRVADAVELAAAATEWLLDPSAARRAGDAGRREVERHRGAVARSVALVEELIGTARSAPP
jgi:3-deoxy-D-manno-octulosonic-acid transferase